MPFLNMQFLNSAGVAAKECLRDIYLDFRSSVMGKSSATADNGIQYDIETNRDSRLLKMAVSVRAGMRDDPADKQGLSHMLEHMMFAQNSETFLDFTDEFYRRGGKINWFTTNRETSYEFLLPHSEDNEIFLPGFVKKVLFEPRFDLQQFEKEKTVLSIERDFSIRRSSIMQHLDELVSGDCVPVLMSGQTPESFARMSLEDLQSHHEKHYVGRNTNVSMSGPLGNPQATLRRIQNIFASIEPGEGKEKFNAWDVFSEFNSGENRIERQGDNVEWAIAFPMMPTPGNPQADVVLEKYLHLRISEQLRGLERARIYSHAVQSVYSNGVSFLGIASESLPADASDVMPEVIKIIGEVARDNMDPVLFIAAQETAKTEIIENFENFGRHNKKLNPRWERNMCARKIHHISEVQPEELVSMARYMLGRQPALVTIGDANNIQSLDEIWDMMREVATLPIGQDYNWQPA